VNLVSWNLNGLEDENLDVRTEAALFELLLGVPIEQAAITPNFSPSTPDIVVLQEVVPRTFHAHITPHLKAAGFTIFPKETSERSYFEVIAVRHPILESHYSKFSYTQQGRGLSTLSINGLTILTAHLESQKAGAPMRIDQAENILKIMNKHKGAIIFAGDTNLRNSEWENLEPVNVSDAWETAGSPKKHKVTWQNTPYKARYDRTWYKGVNIQSVETFGKEKVTGIDQTPSDHLGLRVIFD
jgi:endonuclease/exonuclease/phosphatase family metal-dependent hydrolase